MTIKKILMLAALSVCAASFSSCDFDSALAYGLTDICNVVDGGFVTDDGVKYNITEFRAEGKLDTIKRAYISFDLLEEVKGVSPKEYGIRLNGFGNVEVKSPLYKSMSSSEALGLNAINIFQGWVSGTYFNAQIQYTAFPTSKKEHSYNLVVDDTRHSKDTLYFNMVHNAYGESLDCEGVSVGSVTTVNRMVSFDLSELLKDVKDGKFLCVRWNWFRTAGGFLSKDRQDQQATIVYIAK